MKKIYAFLILILLSIFVQAQTPQQFKYQAALRDNEGNVISNQEVAIIIDILQGSTDGESIFTETHTVTTTSNGLINLNIGSVNKLEDINWSTSRYYIQITVNGLILGVSQLLSVPYALHAKTAENFTGTITESDPVFINWDKSSGITISENQISDFGAYLTVETDPEFSNWNKSSGIQITESQISDLQPYLTTIENQSIASLIDVDLTGINNNNVIKYNSELSKFVVAEAFGTTETDPVFSAWDKSSGIIITENQISNLQDYLTTETDPVFSAWDKSSGISISESQINDFGAYLTVESDPNFSSWDKSTGIIITENQISDLQDYIKEETDPLFVTSAANNITGAGSGSIITSAERTKLENIEAGANVNVQADWNQTNITSDDYIKNKPTAISNFFLDANSQKITNLAEPENTQDAATKAYVDAMEDNVDDADANPTNELQNLSLDGTNLLISNGQGVDLSGIAGGEENQSLEDVLVIGNSAGTKRITDLSPPQETMDAVTKGYVDAMEARITSLELLLGIATLSDVDGNNYEYVQIGTQIWMAENLKVTHYADGTPITLVTSSTTWSNLTENDKAYCYYNNTQGTSYGALYTWAASMNGAEGSEQNPSNVQGVCPDGWHMPSNTEWEQLRDYIGSATAGGKLKETGTSHWTSPNTGATDEYEFTALPNGQRIDNGSFSDRGTSAFFWTTDDYASTHAMGVCLVNNSESMQWSGNSKKKGRSVRCVKD